MKTVLVTGGNRGLGLELTKLLLMNGFYVVIISRQPKQILIDTLHKLNHTSFKVFQADITDYQELKNIKDKLKFDKIKIDIILNNAAVYLERDLDKNTLLSMNLDIIKTSMDTNFLAPLQIIRLFIQDMLNKKCGKIINITSLWSTYNLINEVNDFGKSGAYRLSKQSLNYLTLLISEELKNEENIEIVAICPGWIRTDMGGKEAIKTVAEAASDILWIINNNKKSGVLYAGNELHAW